MPKVRVGGHGEAMGEMFPPEAAWPLGPDWPSGPLILSPAPAWAVLALLRGQMRVLSQFPSVATLTTGAGALLPKIAPGRKEVARPSSRCEQKCEVWPRT